MDYIDFFKQTVRVIKEREYPFSHSAEDQNAALYFSGKEVKRLVSKPERIVPFSMGGRTVFTIENADSFEAARSMYERWPQSIFSDFKMPLVLNFANPHTPGGGVLNGAKAQEEDLCRRSTLYGSLTSAAASGFYSENKASKGSAFTDAAILSPCVEVFRAPDGSFLEEPFDVAVLTMAAPYAPGLASKGAAEVFDLFKARILGMLHIAVENGYQRLVLGAWGCGAFGNDPQLVSRAFFEALKEVRGASHNGRSKGPDCSSLFRHICFAVLDSSPDQMNFRSFKDRFDLFYKDEDDAEIADVMKRIERNEKHLGKYQGCLLGGAAGDALGYAVEFMSDSDIRKRYGTKGILEYDHEFFDGDARFSDDTQMTLFTAAGILHGITRGSMRGIMGHPSMYVRIAYLDWLKTQDPSFEENPDMTWLLSVPELHRRMAPGNTCLKALRSGGTGSTETPINDSKGCGGVMRVAPVGRYFGKRPEYCVECAAEIAAITHGHPLGYISAGAFAYIVARCTYEISANSSHRRRELKKIVDDCCAKLPKWFPEHPNAAKYQAELLQKAMELAKSDEWSCRNIREIGGGWVGEEALAIAIYACMRHANDFSAAIKVAVNHDGDSDSTGAICDNIMGAMLGIGGIDPKWAEGLEMDDLVLEVAKDLCDDCQMEEFGHYVDAIWMAKYGGSSMGTITVNDYLRGKSRLPASEGEKDEAPETLHEMRIRLFERIAPTASGKNVECYSVRTVSERKLRKAIESYAVGYDQDGFVGLIDDSMLSDGSSGALFTRSKMYLSDFPHPPKKIWYDEVAEVQSYGGNKLILTMKDGTEITFSSLGFKEDGLASLLEGLIPLRSACAASNAGIPGFERKFEGALYAGITEGNRQTTNRVAEEERFHAAQGHGFAAEQANDQYDKWHGKKGKVVGNDNAKNGADRLVYERDGSVTFIQDKYCETGKKCIDACFDEDGFRYLDGRGKPMAIEVPSDKYEEAVAAMRERIGNNEVPGVTDPEAAEQIVRPGHYTYQQAKNIAKAGNIDSLVFDAKNGAVVSLSALGVTATIAFATSLWAGEELSVALRCATLEGLRAGGMAFLTSVAASQLSKAGLNSLMVDGTEALAKTLGPKAYAAVANAFRSGKNIAGAAAIKSTAKLIRGNVIASAVTLTLISGYNAVDMFRGRISGQQLFKNMASAGAGIAGGAGGLIGGAALGNLIVPGVGAVVGGIVGSLLAGGGAGMAADAAVGLFVEDDAVRMTAILEKRFSKLVSEHLLSKDEAEKVLDAIAATVDGNLLKVMHSKKDRARFADELIQPIVEEVESHRDKVALPEAEELIGEAEAILKEIEDEIESEGQE